jgi:hypothetical protein
MEDNKCWTDLHVEGSQECDCDERAYCACGKLIHQATEQVEPSENGQVFCSVCTPIKTN